MASEIEQTSTNATFVLTVGLLFALRQEAAIRGVSVSELVRDLLNEALAKKEAVAA